MNKLIALAPLALISFALSGCSSTPEPDNTPFTSAADTCVRTDALEDDGYTIIIDTVGEEDAAAPHSFDDYECIIEALDVPESVKAQWGSTSSLDGKNERSWEAGTEERPDYKQTVTGTYGFHPDDGVDLVLELSHEWYGTND